jgi:acyl carrier protein
LTEAEIYSVLTDIFNDVFFRDDMELKPEMTARDVPGWDSFKQIEIIMAAEERFGVKLQPPEIDQIGNVADLVQALAAKTGAIS